MWFTTVYISAADDKNVSGNLHKHVEIFRCYKIVHQLKCSNKNKHIELERLAQMFETMKGENHY